MSRRYPDTKVCPECRLVVKADRDGNIRPHATRTLAAGITDAACLDSPENLESDTGLPPHLR